MTGFCVNCRKQVDVVDAAVVRQESIGKLVVRGRCLTCGYDIYRISNLDKTQEQS